MFPRTDWEGLMSRMLIWGITGLFTTLAVAAWATVPSHKPASATSDATASRLVTTLMVPLVLMVEAENITTSGQANPF